MFSFLVLKICTVLDSCIDRVCIDRAHQSIRSALRSMHPAWFVRVCRAVRAAGIYADVRVCLRLSRFVYVRLRGTSASAFSGEVVGEILNERSFATVHIC